MLYVKYCTHKQFAIHKIQNNLKKGMVARAFDPNTKITSMASALSESMNDNESDHPFIYKMNSIISNTSTNTYNKLQKLPNMENTDSVRTVDSIGVKMPQYRSSHNNNNNHNHSRRLKNRTNNNNNSTNIGSYSAQQQPPLPKPDSLPKANLDDNELRNKLSLIQKDDKKSRKANHGKSGKLRGRDKKYVRGDSHSSKSSGNSSKSTKKKNKRVQMNDDLYSDNDDYQ